MYEQLGFTRFDDYCVVCVVCTDVNVCTVKCEGLLPYWASCIILASCPCFMQLFLKASFKCSLNRPNVNYKLTTELIGPESTKDSYTTAL